MAINQSPGAEPSSGLTPQQEQAIDALLDPAIGSRNAVADLVGVSSRTIRNWMHLPAFAAAFRQARGEVFRHGAGRLSSMVNRAVDVLWDELNRSREEGVDRDRVAAAAKVLELAKEFQVADLEERVALVEARLAERGLGGPGV